MLRHLATRLMLGFAAAGLLVAAGCGPVKLVATSNIPTPLVVKIPVSVALFIPKDFSEFVYKEERSGTDWNISLGKAQSDGLTRLLTAMFDRVVMVDDVNAGTQAGSDIRAILEPSVEEYAFVTPRDAGSPFFAVSIKYRVNVYTPDGRLADSWGFTGYGTAPSQGISSSAPLTEATALALRDAGAKLAVEFRDQAIVRGLIPESAPLIPVTSQPIPGTATPSSQESTPGAQPAPVSVPGSGGSAPSEQTAPTEAGDPPAEQPTPPAGQSIPPTEQQSAPPAGQSVPPAGQGSLPPPENSTGAPPAEEGSPENVPGAPPAEEKPPEPATAPPPSQPQIPVKKEPDPEQPESLAD